MRSKDVALLRVLSARVRELFLSVAYRHESRDLNKGDDSWQRAEERCRLV